MSFSKIKIFQQKRLSSVKLLKTRVPDSLNKTSKQKKDAKSFTPFKQEVSIQFRLSFTSFEDLLLFLFFKGTHEE